MSASRSLGWEKTGFPPPTSSASERAEALSKETSSTLYDSLQNLPKRPLSIISASSTRAVQTLKRKRPTPSPLQRDNLGCRPISRHTHEPGGEAALRRVLLHPGDGAVHFETRRESIHPDSPPLTPESWHAATASLCQDTQPSPPIHLSTFLPLLPAPSPLSVCPSHCVPHRSSRSSQTSGVHRSSDWSTSGLTVPSNLPLSLFPNPPSHRPIFTRLKQSKPLGLFLPGKVSSYNTRHPCDSTTVPSEESPTSSILRIYQSTYDPWTELCADQHASAMTPEPDSGQQSTAPFGDRLRSRVAPHAMRFENYQSAHQHILNRDSRELSPDSEDEIESSLDQAQQRSYQPQPVLGVVPESDEGESTISNFIGQYQSRHGTPEGSVKGIGASKQTRSQGPQRPLPPTPARQTGILQRAMIENANAWGKDSEAQSHETTDRLLAECSVEQGRRVPQHLQRASEAVTINSDSFSDPSLEGIAGRDRGQVHYVRKSNDFDRSLTWIDPSSSVSHQRNRSTGPSFERSARNPYNNSTRTSAESSSAWTDDEPFDLGDSFDAVTRRQQREAEERIDEQDEEENHGIGHDDEWITVAESTQNVSRNIGHTPTHRSPRSNRNLPNLHTSNAQLNRSSQIIDEADESISQAVPSPLRKAITRESLQSPLQRLKTEFSRMSTSSKRESGSSGLSLSNPPTPQRSMRRKPTFTEEFDDDEFHDIELQNMSHTAPGVALPSQSHGSERTVGHHRRNNRFRTVNPALVGRIRDDDPRQPSTPLSVSNSFARVAPVGAYGNLTGSPGGTNMKATGSSVIDTTNTLRHARTHSDARREALEHLELLRRDGSEEDARIEEERKRSRGEGPGQTFLHRMRIVPVKNKNSRSRLTIPDNYTINADGTMSLGALTPNDDSHSEAFNTMGRVGPRTSSSRDLIDRDLAQLEAQRLHPNPNLVSSEEARSQQLGWSIIFLMGCHAFPPALLLYGHGTLDTVMPYLTRRKVGEMTPSCKRYARIFGIAWTLASIAVVIAVVVAYVFWRRDHHH